MLHSQSYQSNRAGQKNGFATKCNTQQFTRSKNSIKSQIVIDQGTKTSQGSNDSSAQCACALRPGHGSGIRRPLFHREGQLQWLLLPAFNNLFPKLALMFHT